MPRSRPIQGGAILGTSACSSKEFQHNSIIHAFVRNTFSRRLTSTSDNVTVKHDKRGASLTPTGAPSATLSGPRTSPHPRLIRRVQFQRSHENGLGPVRRALQLASAGRVVHAGTVQLQQQLRFDEAVLVGRLAVVVEVQGRELRQQADEVGAGGVKALVNTSRGDVVAAGGDTGGHALKVQLYVLEAAIPDIDLMLCAGRVQKLGNGVGAQRGFEGEIGVGAEGELQAADTLLPGLGVGFTQRPSTLHQRAGEGVRVVPGGAIFLQHAAKQ